MSNSVVFTELVKNPEELSAISKRTADIFQPGDIIVMTGDLGAGKTTFIQFFCQHLGIIDDVTSPTFTIINEYHSGTFPVYHFDFYRLKDLAELKGLNLDDYLFGEGICFLEWGEKVEDVLPKPHYHLEITIENNQTRRVELRKHEH